ncbi:serine hydrolase domain-containing protein [Streptomyces sp. NPDC091265]|uniref:serine hydrolase domain-containing protein n=1 Tax=unclassified Streptomyces TaxID=2593676 RepID=UPI00344E2F8A
MDVEQTGRLRALSLRGEPAGTAWTGRVARKTVPPEVSAVKARSVWLAVSLALAFTVSACGDDSSPGDEQKKRLTKVSEAVLDNGVPGVVVVTAEDGKQTATAWGQGDTAKKVPLSVDDRFRIGSVSKSYVAVIVLQLVDEKKLSLDDKIEKWLPGLVPNGADITVRQLLNHSSGIPNYEDNPKYLAPYLAGDLAHVTTPQQLVRLGTALKPLFPPGTRAAYSNTNYTVAGLLVEKVTGTSLAVQLDRRIFEPLKLRTSYLPTKPGIEGPHAHGYYTIEKPPPTDITEFSPSIAFAGGGIISTAGDVSSFYRGLFGGKLLPPELLKQMMTTVTGVGGVQYGLGLVRRTVPCGTAWGLDGNFPGYLVQSYAKADAERQATIALNLDPNSMSKKALAATTALFDDAFCG